MFAHRFAGFFWLLRFYRPKDCHVFLLNSFQIDSTLIFGLQPESDSLARNNESAEKFEKPNEVDIIHCREDRFMKSKVCVGGCFSLLDLLIDQIQATCHVGEALLSPALRREACGFHLNTDT